MRMRMRAASWLTLVLVASVLGVAGCARPAPEEALRKEIAGFAAAIEARDRGGIDDRLHGEFIGPGGLDRTGVRRMAAGIFLRHREIDVVLGPVDVVSLGDTSAQARFTAAVAGGSGGILPERARVYQVETAWRLEDGDWRLLSVAWDDRL